MYRLPTLWTKATKTAAVNYHGHKDTEHGGRETSPNNGDKKTTRNGQHIPSDRRNTNTGMANSFQPYWREQPPKTHNLNIKTEGAGTIRTSTSTPGYNENQDENRKVMDTQTNTDEEHLEKQSGRDTRGKTNKQVVSSGLATWTNEKHLRGMSTNNKKDKHNSPNKKK